MHIHLYVASHSWKYRKKIISHSWNIFHFQRQTLEYPLCMLCKCICISIDISHYNQRLLTSFFRYIGFHEFKISFQNTGILSIQFSRGGGVVVGPTTTTTKFPHCVLYMTKFLWWFWDILLGQFTAFHGLLYCTT